MKSLKEKQSKHFRKIKEIEMIFEYPNLLKALNDLYDFAISFTQPDIMQGEKYIEPFRQAALLLERLEPSFEFPYNLKRKNQ